MRVGGGYLSIDEFLDIYTPMELEKVERNDPIKKFSEKVAVQKTLQFQSPVRSPKNLTLQRDNSQSSREISSPKANVKKSIVMSESKSVKQLTVSNSEKKEI